MGPPLPRGAHAAARSIVRSIIPQLRTEGPSLLPRRGWALRKGTGTELRRGCSSRASAGWRQIGNESQPRAQSLAAWGRKPRSPRFLPHVRFRMFSDLCCRRPPAGRQRLQSQRRRRIGRGPASRTRRSSPSQISACPQIESLELRGPRLKLVPVPKLRWGRCAEVLYPQGGLNDARGGRPDVLRTLWQRA